MKFKIGQKIVCIKNGVWTNIYDVAVDPSNNPRYGEIVTVSAHCNVLYFGSSFIYLKEYPQHNYSETCFTSILKNNKKIKKVKKTVKVKHSV